MVSNNKKMRRRFVKALKDAGMNVFRIRANDKRPVAEGWQDEALIADVKQWSNGRDYNVGVAPGVMSSGRGRRYQRESIR